MKKVKKEKRKKSVNGADKKKVKKAKEVEEAAEEEAEGGDDEEEGDSVGMGAVDPDRELVDYEKVEIFAKDSLEVRLPSSPATEYRI